MILKFRSKEKNLNIFHFLTVFLYVFYLAFISIAIDFGRCAYPSRESPFFVSGRLMLGCMIPFLFLYCEGVGFVFSKIKNKLIPYSFIFAVSVMILISEFFLSKEAIKSAYNFFHYL